MKDIFEPFEVGYRELRVIAAGGELLRENLFTNREIEQFLAANPGVSSQRCCEDLRRLLGQSDNQRDNKEFRCQLVWRCAKVVPDEINERLGTRDQPSETLPKSLI